MTPPRSSLAAEAVASLRLSLQVLAVLASITALWAAQDFLAPLLLALLVATALSPVVTALSRAMSFFSRAKRLLQSWIPMAMANCLLTNMP